VKRLQQLCRPTTPSLTAFSRRGLAGLAQQPRRQREQTLRNSIVLLADWTAELGWTLPQTAQRLALSARTLRQWHYDLQRACLYVHALGRPLGCALGRPVLRSARHQRNDVIALLDELGPATGVPTLQACFPTMPRAELADLVRRYRRLWRRQHRQLLHTLRWTTPGTVWAMDFAQAPAPIDGVSSPLASLGRGVGGEGIAGGHPFLLAVRDLASGQQLLWLPVMTATADSAVVALRSLFAWHGAPLVLKTDNGSPFCAEATLDLLREKQVLPLFSPPGMPRYNGAAEAGIGSLKTRTETHATRHGRPGHWTWDDVAQAQLEANATARPQGPAGPTPEQSWAQRPALSMAQRQLFQAVVQQHRTEARTEESLPREGPLPSMVERSIDRRAIRRALVEHDYLLFRRRGLPLPFKKRKTAEIT
jgi:transposase InsO family protein